MLRATGAPGVPRKTITQDPADAATAVPSTNTVPLELLLKSGGPLKLEQTRASGVAAPAPARSISRAAVVNPMKIGRLIPRRCSEPPRIATCVLMFFYVMEIGDCRIMIGRGGGTAEFDSLWCFRNFRATFRTGLMRRL